VRYAFKYASRRDANEAGIIRALRIAGALVWQISAKDVPDLLVGFRGRWHLLEVKRPGEDLSPGQREFFLACEQATLPVQVVYSSEDALKAVGAVS